jgi:hypothetical protein
MRKDHFERLRMADCETDVSPFDSLPERAPGGSVRNPDCAALYEKRRFVDCIDKRSQCEAGFHHFRLCSGLIGVSHAA